MTLRDFLNEQKLSPADFAIKVGVSQQSLYRYMAGDRYPRRSVITKIVAATDGKVMPGDLFVVRVEAQAAA